MGGAVARHMRFEKASFHTPGHKGRLAQLVGEDWLRAANDLTELPGLDELSHPQGVLANLEADCAKIYGCRQSFLSVNGASAALAAAIIASRTLGDYILLPRNAHRAAVQATAIAALKPIWYEPQWQAEWGFWGQSTAESIADSLAQFNSKNPDLRVAAVVVVSPTYEGTISDIKAVAEFLAGTPTALIVDSAHGAHFLGQDSLSATASGADAVAHSMHKTLLGLTQTGLLHLNEKSKINAQAARNALNLITSSSPSYLLTASIEHTVRFLESPAGQSLSRHFSDLRNQLIGELQQAESNIFSRLEIYEPDGAITASHILISPKRESPENLYDFMVDRGIFPEAILGKGVLFMLGAGSTQADLTLLSRALQDYVAQSHRASDSTQPSMAQTANFFKKPDFQIVLDPHESLTQAVVTLSREEALGKIAAECVCPCPPGIPVLIPGQKITEEVLERTENKQFTVVAAAITA